MFEDKQNDVNNTVAENLAGVSGLEAPANMTFLETEQNLKLIKPDADLIDNTQPFSSFAAAGHWLKEAFDVRNYWEASQRIGEEVAGLQWAIEDSHEPFDKAKFGKEVLKSGARHLGSDGLRTMGNLLKMTGENFKQNRGGPEMIEKLRYGAGENIVRLGETLKGYADNVAEADILAPDFDGDDVSPKFVQLADSIGAGASQVLSMGLVSRFIGPKATYALFTMGGAGEMFDEAFDKTGDVNAATGLALANAGVTYGIDRWFNPLPKTIAKNARVTAGEIAKEAVGAPLREAGSEVLQQMLAENLVRRVGIDDTQDLFEGLIESAVGAMAGSSVLTGANGGFYAASKTYDTARRKILEKGVAPAELEMAEKGMMQVLREHPEAFQKVLDTHFKMNIMEFEKAAKEAQSATERARADEAAKGFPKVYDELYNRAKVAFGDETKAKTAASVLSAGAVSLFKRQSNLTVKDMVAQFLPEFKQMSYADFLRQTSSEAAVSYMFGGQNAKHADLAKMSGAMIELRQPEPDVNLIWQKTGWHMGVDNKMRFEISDKEARLKLWSPDELTVASEKLFSKEINELNEIKAKTAAFLDKYTGSMFADYYKEFWEYLKTRVNTKYVLDDSSEKGYVTDYYKVLDEANLIKREIEAEYLDKLWDKFVHTERDFSEEEYKDIRMMWESRRYNHFLQNFVNVNGGMPDELEAFSLWEHLKYPVDMRKLKLTRRSMKEGLDALANEINDDWFDKPEFQQRLREIREEFLAKNAERRKSIKSFGLPDEPALYRDIKIDDGYKTYVLYQGDVSKNFDDKDYRSKAYMEAFNGQTFGEEFLRQDKFSHLSRAEKEVLSEFLIQVEFLYRVNSRVEQLQKTFAEKLKVKNADDLENLKNGWVSPEQQMKLQQRVLLENGTAMKLKDLLIHDELYANYPEVADTNVEFKVLRDEAPYHFYHDINKGHVLEIDARSLNYTGLKETLLKGAEFAIQDIEGFDYSLADVDRRNFMDRQVFLARQELSDVVTDEIRNFLEIFPVTKNVKDVVKMQSMPIVLAGLGESRAVDGKIESLKQGRYAEVDFKRLEDLIDNYFADAYSEDEVQLVNLAKARLQKIKNRYAQNVTMLARANGGYNATWMPWGGITSQAAVDERALIRRLDYTDEQRRDIPYWADYVPDMMYTYDEFLDRAKTDEKDYRKVVKQIAEGAYEYGNKTINLFENADAETIVHESFHYFWDMLNRQELRHNTNAVEFREAMADLRQEFIKLYRIEQYNGKYYAVERATNVVAPEMPVGYESVKAVADAGMQEMFVGTFLAKMNRQGWPDEQLGMAMDFYENWLKEMTGRLGITAKSSGTAGQKILQFLKRKK